MRHRSIGWRAEDEHSLINVLEANGHPQEHSHSEVIHLFSQSVSHIPHVLLKIYQLKILLVWQPCFKLFDSQLLFRSIKLLLLKPLPLFSFESLSDNHLLLLHQAFLKIGLELSILLFGDLLHPLHFIVVPLVQVVVHVA